MTIYNMTILIINYLEIMQIDTNKYSCHNSILYITFSSRLSIKIDELIFA